MPRVRCLEWPAAGCAGYCYPGPRCPACTQRRKKVRNDDRPIAKAVVAAWVAKHGWVCPGWGRAPHPSRNLTADHVIPLARGGTNNGPRRVLCNPCNARKGTA